jgi:hypothetical protein
MSNLKLSIFSFLLTLFLVNTTLSNYNLDTLSNYNLDTSSNYNLDDIFNPKELADLYHPSKEHPNYKHPKTKVFINGRLEMIKVPTDDNSILLPTYNKDAACIEIIPMLKKTLEEYEMRDIDPEDFDLLNDIVVAILSTNPEYIETIKNFKQAQQIITRV